MLDQSVHQSLGKICILCAYLNKLCISHANFPWAFWSSEGMANENRKDKIAESEGFCLQLLSLFNWKCCVRIQPYPVISVWKSVILCSNMWKRIENLWDFKNSKSSKASQIQGELCASLLYATLQTTCLQVRKWVTISPAAIYNEKGRFRELKGMYVGQKVTDSTVVYF